MTANRIRSFASVLSELVQAIDRLERSAGKALHPQSRARKYLRDVESLDREWRKDGGRDLIAQATLSDLLNSLTEADTICQLVNKLLDRVDQSDDIAGRLFDALQGPLHSEQESATSNAARNLFFELRILDFCLSAGLTAQSRLHPDVLTTVGNTAIHIECKRIFAARNLAKLVASARDQLNLQLQQSDNAIGVIALDFSKLIAESRPYVQIVGASDWRRAEAGISTRINNEYQADIAKALGRTDPGRIRGLLYFFHVATWNNLTRMFGTAYSLQVVPIKNDPLRNATLQRFHAALASAL